VRRDGLLISVLRVKSARLIVEGLEAAVPVVFAVLVSCVAISASVALRAIRIGTRDLRVSIPNLTPS
jgi:hypothetical protein